MQLQKLAAPVFMLGMGNRKLGDVVYTFSLPAVLTCPGRSKLCEKVCYALRGHMRMVLDAGHYHRKLEAANQADFADRMVREIRFRQCQLVRIHVAGDFYSPEYVRKWVEIVEASPQTKFFVYTRSWRVAEIRQPDLGFRVKRKSLQKRIGGAIVCPVENGAKAEVTCQKCGLCWEPLAVKDPRRFALPVV